MNKILNATTTEILNAISFKTCVEADVNNSFNAMRLYQPRGPLVNSEFYPGWLSHWDEKFATVATSDILKMTATLLAMNASFNFYMFHGGTNFGFTAGKYIILLYLRLSISNRTR